jgi:hypothetical protein
MAIRIGFFRSQQYRTEESVEWLMKAARSKHPHDDCWEVHAAVEMPFFLKTRADEKREWEKWHTRIDELLSRDQLTARLPSCIRTAFWFAYYDIDIVPALQKWNALHEKLFPHLFQVSPHLLPPASSSLIAQADGRLRVGFISSFISKDSRSLTRPPAT